MVTVYSKPACPQCDMTKRELQKKNIAFDTVDLTKDSDALDYVTSLGHRAAPVVVAGEANWSGFRPDLIRGLSA